MASLSLRVTALAAAALFGCGSGDVSPLPPPPVHPATVHVVAGDGQSATTATQPSVAPTVIVRDSGGQPMAGVSVAFNVLAGGGRIVVSPAVTNSAGQASAFWYLGPAAGQQVLEARVGSLAVTFSATAHRPSSGAVTFGFGDYVEWIPGDLPVVVSAPHGGTLLPADIPDRAVGTTTRDLNTEELAREVAAAFVARYGRRPHIIISRLHRRKLDPNREIVEAAAGNPIAERAWREYHGFIEASVAEARLTPGLGFYVDLHGHGHDIQRLELGYLVNEGKLALSDSQLSGDITMQVSSLWPLAMVRGIAFPTLLRGSPSLGALLEGRGYPSVPSPANPSPGSNPYFDGGYSTQRHGTSTDNRFAGVQIEANFDGVRDNAANRAAFARALVSALDSLLPGSFAQRRP